MLEEIQTLRPSSTLRKMFNRRWSWLCRELRMGGRENTLSFLTIVFVMSGPAVFLWLQNNSVPFAVSFSIFIFLTVIGFYFQWLRIQETKRLLKLAQGQRGPRVFRFKVGDELNFEGNRYIVLRHGFNHYYLKPLQANHVRLVKRQKVELFLS